MCFRICWFLLEIISSLNIFFAVFILSCVSCFIRPVFPLQAAAFISQTIWDGDYDS
jgi:hypothetical protein